MRRKPFVSMLVPGTILSVVLSSWSIRQPIVSPATGSWRSGASLDATPMWARDRAVTCC